MYRVTVNTATPSPVRNRNIRLPDNVWRAAKASAVSRGESLTKWLIRAIFNELAVVEVLDGSSQRAVRRLPCEPSRPGDPGMVTSSDDLYVAFDPESKAGETGNEGEQDNEE